MAKYSGGLLGKAYNEVGNFVTRSPSKIDKALRDSIREAANRFPGYEVHAYSGYRPGDKRQHGKAKAIDVALVDKKTGQVLDNYQNASTFRTYEKFAQVVREVQMEKHPELANDLRWGGYFSGSKGKYGAVDVMHFDTAGHIGMAGGSWEEGLTDAQRAMFPGIQSVGMNQISLPDTVGVPQSREQAMAQAAKQSASAAAYSNPTRALDVSIPSSQLASQYAQYQRGTVPALSRPSAPPSNFSVPARPSPIGSAPVGQVSRAPLGPALSRPTPPGNFAGGTTPAAAPSIRQAAGTPTAGYNPKAQAAGTPTAGYDAKAQPAGTPTAGYNSKAPSVEKMAANYGAYRTPTNYPNVQKAMQAQPMSLEDQKLAAAYTQYGLTKALAPTTPVAAPPAIAAPPAQVLAPALVQRPAVNDYPVANIPAAPKATAYDVYSGMADTAKDNTGQNTIGRLPDGTTTVTNKYGVTTGMTPYGKQTAVGSLPGISGPVGQAVKGAVPTMAGGLAGGLLGGPLGALIGATLVKEIAKPGGLLSKQNSFNTDWFGNIVTNKAVSGLGFPDRPSSPAGARNQRGFDSASDRSHAYGISPGAAAAIDKGGGGLY